MEARLLVVRSPTVKRAWEFAKQLLSDGPVRLVELKKRLLQAGFRRWVYSLVRQCDELHEGRIAGPKDARYIWLKDVRPQEELDERGVPILNAYDHSPGIWKVWCRYCDRWHSHGAAPGYRAAHCHNSDHYASYSLRYAGEWPGDRAASAQSQSAGRRF